MAATLQRLKPYDPESKGMVERRNGFFETSSMPGRTFTSPADFNTQFSDWHTQIANARVVRIGDVNLTWPQGDGLIWPHLVVRG